jgi:hypothetical protein
MWLKFQRHACNTSPESNTDSIVSEPGSIANANSVANPNSITHTNSIANSHSHARRPIGLISGDLVLPGWQKRVTRRDDYR